MSKLRLIFLIILLPIVFFHCETNNPVPEVYVNFRIELNSPLYNGLNSVGNSILIPNEGNKGIIVTRANFEKFIAYDATCTYDPIDEWGRVQIDGVFAVDTVCGSKFHLLLDGNIHSGPASVALKTYITSYNPNLNNLLIHN